MIHGIGFMSVTNLQIRNSPEGFNCFLLIQWSCFAATLTRLNLPGLYPPDYAPELYPWTIPLDYTDYLAQSVRCLPAVGGVRVQFPKRDMTDLWLVIGSMAGTSQSAPVCCVLPLEHYKYVIYVT